MLRFQVVQEREGEIAFKAEVKQEMNDRELGVVRDALMPFFRKVGISQHRHLDPGPGGKFSYIISNIVDH
jgi:hypothetical protein